jgi:hypothetical protein
MVTLHLLSPRPTNKWGVTNLVGRHQLDGASAKSGSSVSSLPQAAAGSSTDTGWLLGCFAMARIR